MAGKAKQSHGVTKSAASVEKKEPGQLDLMGVFEAEALDLKAAVARGSILHRTRNIRDSGAPLEAGFRSFLAARLPSQFDVLQGYLFDRNSECTPQIDAILVDTRDCFGMLEADGGTLYLPFTAALALIEIKNSGKNAPAALNQLKKIKTSMDGMRRQILERSTSRKSVAPIPEPITVLFFANSDGLSFRKLKAWYKENATSYPTYTVLLDRNLIVADSHISSSVLIFPSNHITFDASENPLEPYVCKPRNVNDTQDGNVLLWLFFALVDKVNRSESSPRAIIEFTRDAAEKYALDPVEALRTMSPKTWNELNGQVSAVKPTAKMTKAAGAKVSTGKGAGKTPKAAPLSDGSSIRFNRPAAKKVPSAS